MEKSFSLFANFKQTTPSEITLDRVYRLITTDSDLRDRTEKFRFYLRVGNKQMSACEKTSCPAFTPAVRCEGGRKRMHIKAYTGLSLCGGLCRPPCPFGLPYDQRTGAARHLRFSL